MKIKTHLLIIIWMMLGSAILLNQVIQPIMIVETEVKTEQSDDGNATESDEDTYVLQANVAINSFSPISLHQELYQIREIILDEVEDPQSTLEVENLTESDHFRTLFSQVISPNAP